MLAQLAAVGIAVAGGTRHDQLHVRLDLLKRFHQQMTSLLGRKSSQKQNYLPGSRPHAKIWRAVSQNSPIGHVEGFLSMNGSIALLQRSRDDHRSVWQSHRSLLPHAKYSRCQTAPLPPLPIEPLHRNGGFHSKKSWNEREQR